MNARIKILDIFFTNYLFFFLNLLLLQCSSFLIGDPPSVLQPVTHTEKKVSYELLGWKGKENKIKATEILKTLHRSNRFKEISHFVHSETDWKIQIILESSPEFSILLSEPEQPLSWMFEKEPERFSLYLLNRIFSMSTRLFIPVLKFSEDIITFKIWKFNQKIGEYTYSVKTWTAFGWVSLILFPMDDRKDIRKIYQDYALKFLKDSEKVYE